MTQNSKQSQNNQTKIKSQSVTFTIAVMKKKKKRITLRKHNVIWKTMRTPVLEFL